MEINLKDVLITGNKFKRCAHYSYDEYGFIKHIEPNDNEFLKIFVKIDYVHNFFKQKQEKPYILITHNGDIPVDDNYLQYMNDPYLIKWFGQNIMTRHNKLLSIPIGIANEKWEQGNENIFHEVVNKNSLKERLIYVNFDVNTNIVERNFCLSELNKKGLEMDNKLPFKEYLGELGKSYFVVSPLETIDFAKNFNNLVLSEGSFSWWIGFLSHANNVYYNERPRFWHGDIFVVSKWKKLKYDWDPTCIDTNNILKCSKIIKNNEV
jgi:hypothetical protein